MALFSLALRLSLRRINSRLTSIVSLERSNIPILRNCMSRLLHCLIGTQSTRRIVRLGERYRSPVDGIIRRGTCETEERSAEVGHGIDISGVGRVGCNSGTTDEEGDENVCVPMERG